MSREDPQLRIRLPIDLKEKVEDSAKANGRSMNAEIVQRLDVSFLGEIPSDELISAKDAIHIANKAKVELSNIVLKRTFSLINKKIRMGHTTFYVDVSDLELSELSEDDFVSVFKPTFSRLKELGYVVHDEEWDAEGFMIAIP